MHGKMSLGMLVVLSVIGMMLIGCATHPVLYSSLTNAENVSSISFEPQNKNRNPLVTFVSYNGLPLPKPEKKTHWDPVNFPSDQELRIIVHAKYETKSKTSLSGFGVLGAVVNLAQDIRAVSRNVDADVVFISPPLEAGKNYLLVFVKEPGMPGKNILTLTDIDTKQVIVQQEFEVVFGGDEAL